MRLPASLKTVVGEGNYKPLPLWGEVWRGAFPWGFWGRLNRFYKYGKRNQK